MLEIFEPKLGKLVAKLKLKLEKFILLELDIRSSSRFSSLMKLEFDVMYSDGSNYVGSSMFDHSKPKIGCSSSIINR